MWTLILYAAEIELVLQVWEYLNTNENALLAVGPGCEHPSVFFSTTPPGVHRDLCWRDALQTGGYGPLLLLPGGLELL